MKRVIPGQPLSIAASDHNQMVDAAQAFLRASQAGPGGQPRRDRILPSIVTVFNKTGEEDEADAVDWPIWHPVCVGYTTDPRGTVAMQFAERPFYPGYNLNKADWHTAYLVLGITQEPIRAGLSGEVCIAGPTMALVQKRPDGWTDQAGWDAVHVWHDAANDRWTLRNGPGGDARLLKILDGTNLYQDGTYNDQYLALIDLCEMPERVRFQNGTGSAVAPHSILKRTPLGAGAKLGTSTSSYSVAHDDLVATCGWTVAAGAYGFAYSIGDRPVKVRFALDYAPALGDTLGVAGAELAAWPKLPGMVVRARDWYKAGETYYVWVRRRWLPFHAKRSGANYYPAFSDGTVVYDGGTYGGVVYPVIKASVQYPQIYASGITDPRDPNIQDGQIFPCDAVTASGALLASAGVLDDPIGTVKLWASELAPPPGWRIFTPSVGRFPIGIDASEADFDELGEQGGARTHTHTFSGGGGVAAGSDGTLQAADHLPPYFALHFIERYQ